MKFQTFKLDLDQAEEPEIKLPTSVGSPEKQESSKKLIYFCFIDYVKAVDCASQQTVENSYSDGYTRSPYILQKNMCVGQEASVRTGHGITDWFHIGKQIGQDFILSSCLFNLYAEYIMQNARLDEAKVGINIAGRNINILRCAETLPLWRKAMRK